MPPTPPGVRVLTQHQVADLMARLNENPGSLIEAVTQERHPGDSDRIGLVARYMPELEATFGERYQNRSESEKRERVRTILRRLGINESTPENYRLAIYNDGTQSVALIGRVGENGNIIADRRILLPNNSDTWSTALTLVGGASGANVGPLEGGGTITIPAPNTNRPAEGLIGGTLLNLTPEQLQLLRTRVLLLAQDNQANPGMQNALAQANDPSHTPREIATEEAVVPRLVAAVLPRTPGGGVDV